jgi:hypothetical protein
MIGLSPPLRMRPPKTVSWNHGWEWRCWRDPDCHLIEAGQYTQIALDYFKKYAT